MARLTEVPMKSDAQKVFSLAAVVVAAIVGGIAIRQVSFEDDSQITAHRGASGAAPGLSGTGAP